MFYIFMYIRSIAKNVFHFFNMRVQIRLLHIIKIISRNNKWLKETI